MTTHPLIPAYGRTFDALADQGRYAVRGVAEHYLDHGARPDPGRVTVVLRVDVDCGLHLVPALAEALHARGLRGSIYFLTHPERHYRLWDSGIPARAAALGLEVGLHSDHLYEQLTDGVDGLARLREDVARLAHEAGAPVRGMTFHGHPEIEALGRTNWELTRDVPPAALGLEYHDGRGGPYHDPARGSWWPPCDLALSDYMGWPRASGWAYWPGWPLRVLGRARPGQTVHLTLHVKNAFDFRRGWDTGWGETCPPREPRLRFLARSAAVRWRKGLLRDRSLAYVLAIGGARALAVVLARGLGPLTRRPAEPEPDTGWDEGRRRIFAKGLDFWRAHLERLGMTAPGGEVLEVGSGDGQWLLALARDAASVDGVEPNDAYRERCAQTLGEHPELAPRITLHAASAEALPFPDASFDRVLCAGVFMFTRQAEAMREMARVLRPGGRLCVTVNGLGYFLMYVKNGVRHRSTAKARYGLLGLLGTLAKWWAGRDVDLAKAVSHAEMRDLLAANGLRLEQTHLFLAQEDFPLEHFGFPTNYAFIARRLPGEDGP